MAGNASPIRVLHVDDDPEMLDLVAAFLERDDHITVESATSATEGLDRLGGVDCVVADYEMPGKDGIEFLEAVREEYPTLPFILFTGKGSEEVASEAIAAGVTGYLQKKGSSEQYTRLANRIENAVEQRRASERAAKLERIRRVVRDANQALVRAETRSEVEQRVCEIVTEAKPYDFAWIGVLDEASGTVEPRASAGREDGYFDDVTIPVDETSTAHSPTGAALAERELNVVQSITDHPDSASWREPATERGYQAGAAVPLRFQDEIFGVLTVYSTETGTFDDEERELLRELGGDIGHAIHRIEQERRYRRLFEESVNGLAVHEIVTDDDGDPVDYVFLEANDSFERLTGLDLDEICGKRATELLPGLDTALVETYGTVAIEGESVRFDHYSQALDRHYDIAAFPVGDDQFVTAFTDITDRMEHQQELETILDRMGDAAFVYPPGRTFTFVNRAAIEQYGYDEEALLEMAPADLNAADPVETTGNRIRQVTEEGQLVFETEHETNDGETIPVEINATLVTFRGESAILSIVRDVTRRREMEHDLKALHDIATQIEAAESEDAIYELLVEAAESILEFDVAMVDIIEDGALTSQAISSETESDQYYEEMPVDGDGIAPEVYRSGEASIVEDLRRRDDKPADSTFRSVLTVPIGEYGTFQTVSEEVAAYDEQDRELTETLVAHASEQLSRLENERELQEQRAELERQNGRLEAFASLVSHDLRNPLNVANLRTELASEECDSEHFDAINRAHERMEALIDDILAVAREETGDVDTGPVQLGDVVGEAWQHVETGEATLSVDADCVIRADRHRLLRLLENLARNAVEHGGESVTVSVGPLEDGFYVADDGPGIPPDERDAIFEDGFSTQQDGTGFGLSIVEQIVGAHGWAVDVTDSEDGGARFEITGIEVIE